MGERAVCRLITNSIRLLTNHSSTIALCGVPGPRAIGKEPRLHVLDFLWGLSFLPSYVSRYIIRNSSLSLAYGSCTPAQCSTRILKDQQVNSNHDFWVNWNPFY